MKALDVVGIALVLAGITVQIRSLLLLVCSPLHMHCKHCGYVLLNLQKCPECGKSRTQRVSMRRAIQRIKAHRSLALVVLGIVVYKHDAIRSEGAFAFVPTHVLIRLTGTAYGDTRSAEIVLHRIGAMNELSAFQKPQLSARNARCLITHGSDYIVRHPDSPLTPTMLAVIMQIDTCGESIDRMSVLLLSADADIARLAAFHIKSVTSSVTTISHACWRRLADGAAGRDRETAMSCIAALGNMPQYKDRSAQTLIDEMANSDPDIRLVSIQAIERLDLSSRARGELSLLADSDPNPAVRMESGNVLRRLAKKLSSTSESSDRGK